MRDATVLLVLLVTACGGAGGKETSEASAPDVEDVGYAAEDLVPRAVLSRAELTTAVDAKRYRAAAPVQTAFDIEERVIYFVGRLKRVPTDATIEVRWFLDSDPRPMLVSDIQGSDSFQFVASFSPVEEVFTRGSYSARVFVDDREVGGVSFVIGDTDPDGIHGPRVSNVAFSKSVSGDMKPEKPKSRFGRGIRKLYVSFDVKGAEPDSVADIYWYRGHQAFHNSEVHVTGNQRYSAHIASASGLPSGEYRVEIHLGGEKAAETRVSVGNGTGGPSIDDIAFGSALSDSNMPTQRKRRFERDTEVIQCGLRFVDLAPNSVIELQWFHLEEDGESQVYTTRSRLADGGSGTMGAAWSPRHSLSRGEYKVVVLVNDMAMREAAFKVD